MDGLPDPDWYFENVLYWAEPGGAAVVLGPIAEWEAWWRLQDVRLTREHPHLAAVARTQGFVLCSSQLAELGVSRERVRRAIARGVWMSTQRGAVSLICVTDDSPLGRRRRHALACASAALMNPGCVISGRSAAILHGLPTMEIPTVPELTAAPALRTNRFRVAAVPDADVTSWFGVVTTSPARTVIDAARHDRRDGLMAADAALRERRVTEADLAQALTAAGNWPGVWQARELIALASPNAESPLESVLRLALHDDGFPPPDLQFVIELPGTRRSMRVDMMWPEHGLIVEADGRTKYADDPRRTKDPLWREKKRETALRRLGYQVERVLWSDVVDDWPETSALLRSALGL